MLTERDLRTRMGPVLSDGTVFRDLFDFERREVARRVMADPELFRLEMKKIFARSWMPLAHQSEIPNPGDFVVRFLTDADKVIVARDDDGQINVLENVCAHRGMELCWADEGNAASFACPYHRWVFDCKGGLLGAPHEREMYGDWDKSQYGLRRARVAVRWGFVFATFYDKAPSFEDWQGDAGWYWDRMLAGAEDYELLGPPLRTVQRANWKTTADQIAGDNYHFAGTHQNTKELGYYPPGGSGIDANFTDVVKVAFPGTGHMVYGAEPPERKFGIREMTDDEAYSYENRGWWFSHMYPSHVWLGKTKADPWGDMEIPLEMEIPLFRPNTVGLYVGQPKGPELSEICNFYFVDKATPEPVKEAMRKNSNVPVADQQDQQSFLGVQRGTRGVVAGEGMMKYPARSPVGPNPPKGWPGPGEVYAGMSRDETQWHFWLRYFELMTADEEG